MRSDGNKINNKRQRGEKADPGEEAHAAQRRAAGDFEARIFGHRCVRSNLRVIRRAKKDSPAAERKSILRGGRMDEERLKFRRYRCLAARRSSGPYRRCCRLV